MLGAEARHFQRIAHAAAGLARKVLQRYQLPLAELCEWNKLGLALAASAVALAAMHGAMIYLPHGAAGAVGGLAVFGVVYAVAARLILREEYGYLMRALSRRRKAA